MDSAAPRRNWMPGGTGDDGLAEWMTEELQRNPGYQIPQGYEMRDGRVQKDERSIFIRHPWLIPLMGAGGGLAAAGAAGTLGGAAAGAGGAGSTAGTAATAAGTGSTIANALRRMAPLAAAAPMVAGLFNRGGGSPGGDINSLMNSIPQLREMMELKQRQAQRQDPLHEAVTQMSLNLMPRSGLRTYPGRPEVE